MNVFNAPTGAGGICHLRRHRRIDSMVAQGGAAMSGVAMSDLMLLSEAQMRRITPYFPLSHGIPRVDDRRIISGIIFVLRNGLRWRDAPKEYGPHKTIYNRFIRWSRLGVFSRILAELTTSRGKREQLMIDATHLKAHRTAASLLKKGMLPDVSGEPKAV
jgi:putative transposase